MNRRSFLLGAPAVILTPGLLMLVKVLASALPNFSLFPYGTIKMFWEASSPMPNGVSEAVVTMRMWDGYRWSLLTPGQLLQTHQKVHVEAWLR